MLENIHANLARMLKSPLDRSTAMKGLALIVRAFPNLTESKFIEERNMHSLLNLETASDKQILFTLARHREFDLSWGPLAEVDFEPDMEKLFNTIQDGFQIFPLNVERVEMRFYAVSEWEGHHYRAILDALLRAPPLGLLFEPNRILQNDLYLRGLLDETRVGVVAVRSDVADSEVINNAFQNDLLRAWAGVAQTRGIPNDARLVDVFMETSQVAIDFMCQKFVPLVVEPLDKALIGLSQKGAVGANGGDSQGDS